MSIPPREGSRDSGKGIIVSIYPDVCYAKKTPIPFTIYAIQEEDANTAPSVRMTGQRAHNMASMTTCCHGDEPGVAGVISGTVGGVCEPKTHSATVRIEGKPAIRHNDEWWMNCKNTTGKLCWIESTESFEPTPPLKEAPKKSDSNEIMSDAASPSELWEPGAQTAFLDESGRYTTPGTQSQPKPSVPAGTPQPNLRWWQRITRLRIRGPAAGMDMMLELESLLDETINRPDEWADKGFWKKAPESSVGKPNTAPYSVPTGDGQSHIQPQPALQPQAETQESEPETTVDVPPDPHARTEENVSVKRDEDRDTCEECVVGPYSIVSRLCTAACGSGAQAHHIIPDFTKRYGNRAEGLKGSKRVPGLPAFSDGASICLMGGAKIEGSEHWEAHGADNAIKTLGHGKSHYPAGTAPFRRVVEVSKDQVVAMKASDPACVAKIEAEVAKETAGVNLDTLARTTPDMWPEVGSPAYEALSQGMLATIH